MSHLPLKTKTRIISHFSYLDQGATTHTNQTHTFISIKRRNTKQSHKDKNEQNDRHLFACCPACRLVDGSDPAWLRSTHAASSAVLATRSSTDHIRLWCRCCMSMGLGFPIMPFFRPFPFFGGFNPTDEGWFVCLFFFYSFCCQIFYGVESTHSSQFRLFSGDTNHQGALHI